MRSAAGGSSPVRGHKATLSSKPSARILHGREGSTVRVHQRPLHKSSANRAIVLPASAKFVRLAGTRRVHFWDWRTLAGTRDVSRHSPKRARDLDRDRQLAKFLQTGGRRCPSWRDADSLL